MRLMLLFIGTVLLASCKTANIVMEPANGPVSYPAALDSAFYFNDRYEYVIRQNDKISISVWGQDDLSVGSVYGIYNSNEVYGKWLMVDAAGQIAVPKIGTVKVDQMTVPELKQLLTTQYARWVQQPVVDVKVLNKEITILGEVRNPQVLKVDEDLHSLFEIIARGGGLEFYADLRYIKVLRQDGQHVRVANINLTGSGNSLYKNIQIHPGDIVIVPSRKCKNFDKRVSVIIPFTTTATAAAVLMGAF